MTTPTTAIQPFEPANVDQAMRLAETLARSNLLPAPLRGKPPDVLLVLMAGRELGISPLQALRGIHVIEGKPVLSAELMVAQCLRRPDVCRFFRLAESTDQRATYETQRAGSEPVKFAYTLEQAQRAKLTGKGNWSAHPAAMLRARCSSALARAVYPDLVGGMYDPDEAAEFAPKEQLRPPPRPGRVVDLNPAPAQRPPPPQQGPEDAQVVEETLAAAQESAATAADAELPMAEKIRACLSMEALTMLVDEIKRLPEQDRAAIREVYATRRAELAREAAEQETANA